MADRRRPEPGGPDAADDRLAGDATLSLEAPFSPAERAIEDECQHRVRNVLAVVRSVLRRTIAVGGSGEHMIDHFSGRLDALARAHRACIVHPDARIDLEELIRGELHAFRFGNDPRIALGGAPCSVELAKGQVLGLVFHELVTNSFKFGALSAEGSSARVAVAWSVRDGRLLIEWIESRVPVIGAAPRRRGFGTEFMEQAVPYQLGGEVILDLAPGGITCRLSLPLAAGEGKDGYGWN